MSRSTSVIFFVAESISVMRSCGNVSARGMPGTPGVEEVFEAYLERHVARDLEGVVSLFAADAVVEDPVGSPAHVGRAAIREFIRSAHQRNGQLRVERIGPVVVCGREAAAHIRAAAEAMDFQREFDVMYTLAVDDAGAITALRAFFEFDGSTSGED